MMANKFPNDITQVSYVFILSVDVIANYFCIIRSRHFALITKSFCFQKLFRTLHRKLSLMDLMGKSNLGEG